MSVRVHVESANKWSGGRSVALWTQISFWSSMFMYNGGVSARRETLQNYTGASLVNDPVAQHDWTIFVPLSKHSDLKLGPQESVMFKL